MVQRSSASPARDRADLHQIVVEHRPVAHVGLALRRRLVRVARRPRRTCPTRSTAPTTTPSRIASSTRATAVNAPRSLCTTTRVPARDAAPLGVVGMEQALRLARAAPQRVDVHERRVQELVRRRRDQRQRIARRQLGRRLRELVRRRVRRHRIEPHLRHALRVELALAARRREAALGERQIRRRHVEPHPARLEQRLERHALQLRRLSSRAPGGSASRSSSRNAGSSRPMRAASRRKISLFGCASPSGAIAGWLSVT